MNKKKLFLKSLMKLGQYPAIRFTYSPFKMIEFEEMIRRVNFRGNERALDIGCGDGLHTLLLGEKVGHITGIDVDSSFIADARSYAAGYTHKAKVDFLDQPMEEIRFTDELFDLIFSICVIEHIPNHEEVLAECLRTLKPGGQIVFTVDTLETINDEDLKKQHTVAHHVQRYFRMDTLRALLEEIGFEVQEMQNLFRSERARELFEQGIREGFNFGRLKCVKLADELREAEDQVGLDRPGTFLLVVARKPVF